MKWISIEDELPAKEPTGLLSKIHEVHVDGENGEYLTKAFYNHIKKTWESEDHGIVKVIHWLPEPPE